jgi:hypothetical protein
MALECPQPPTLEKVKAHDDAALRLGHPKALGNDLADKFAKKAAAGIDVPVWSVDSSEFEDPVRLLDSSGSVILVVQQAFPLAFWQSARAARRRPRQWLDLVYDPQHPVLWDISTSLLRRPIISGTQFVHPAQPAVIKWCSRVRAGCLATRLRLQSRGLADSEQCLCCGMTVEDDAHVLYGCSATGTVDWLNLLREVWAATARTTHLEVPLPDMGWCEIHRPRLFAALIPSSIKSLLSLSPSDTTRFLGRLHLNLAGMVAERLRRREELMEAQRAILPTPSPTPVAPLASFTLSADRQLSASTLRALEVQRRTLPSLVPSPASVVPSSGEPRRNWLRLRLQQLLEDETVVCVTPRMVRKLKFSWSCLSG